MLIKDRQHWRLAWKGGLECRRNNCLWPRPGRKGDAQSQSPTVCSSAAHRIKKSSTQWTNPWPCHQNTQIWGDDGLNISSNVMPSKGHNYTAPRTQSWWDRPNKSEGHLLIFVKRNQSSKRQMWFKTNKQTNQKKQTKPEMCSFQIKEDFRVKTKCNPQW